MSEPEILSLFPEGTSLDVDGELLLGGCRADALAAQFGTPAYVVDEDSLRAQARRYRDTLSAAWPRSSVVFASKAFPCTAAYRVMADEGLSVDVAGGGELVMALAGGMDPARLVMHGNAKTDDELAMAVEAGVGTIVLDNTDDIDRLEKLVTGEQAVLVRVIPGIAGGTHAALETGSDHSKFGLSLTDARRAIERLRGSDHLRLDGIHLHVGSQIMDTQPFADAARVAAELGEFDVYDLGGGLGARYTYADSPPTVEQYVRALTDSARQHLPSGARILIEPGRSMVARSGVTLYRVVTVKQGSTGAPTFVAVDGGMADNLEVSLYGQRFEATVTARVGGGDPVELVGRHCESGDCLVHGVPLREPMVGDVVAVPVTGAYCFTMQNNYNGALRPPVVFAAGGEARAVVRRETYADLTARDLS